MVEPKLWTPGQPIAQEQPRENRYLLACTECPPTRAGAPVVLPFDSDEERGLWATNHTNWAGHTAFMAREEPKT